MTARQTASARSLTLTEELEKLEQSITLTLQEIDHNFSRAHRIVTTSILPLVDSYGEHSRAVWEASKFWKQFFEASANVSLSGYEDLANEDNEAAESNDHDEKAAADASRLADESIDHDDDDDDDDDDDRKAEDSLLDNKEVSGSTPRPRASQGPGDRFKPRFSSLESPYEALRREMRAEERDATSADDSDGPGDSDDNEVEDSSFLFRQQTARLPFMSGASRAAGADGDGDGQSERKQQDPLLHKVLDKTYRLHTTHHKPPFRATPLKSGGRKQDAPIWEDSPTSSPEMAKPTLRSRAFLSPPKAAGPGRPRTPGLSMQTPMKAGKTRDVFGGDGRRTAAPGAAPGSTHREEYEAKWESDSDDGDLYAGMSPPKTIQFALPPSKLMQTPAREASKRIVESILLTAGAEPEASTDYSPTMVKMNEDVLNDSF